MSNPARTAKRKADESSSRAGANPESLSWQKGRSFSGPSSGARAPKKLFRAFLWLLTTIRIRILVDLRFASTSPTMFTLTS